MTAKIGFVFFCIFSLSVLGVAAKESQPEKLRRNVQTITLFVRTHLLFMTPRNNLNMNLSGKMGRLLRILDRIVYRHNIRLCRPSCTGIFI